MTAQTKELTIQELTEQAAKRIQTEADAITQLYIDINRALLEYGQKLGNSEGTGLLHYLGTHSSEGVMYIQHGADELKKTLRDDKPESDLDLILRKTLQEKLREKEG